MVQRRLVLVMSFTYRGLPEEYQNAFHFNGAEPASEAGWKSLSDEVWTALKPAHRASSSLVRAYGYGDDSAVADVTIDYVNEYGGAIAGTLANQASSPVCAGDQAYVLRYVTPKRSSKNKPVYLYTYLHNIYVALLSAENVDTTHRTAIANAYVKLTNGTLAQFGVRTTPDGVAATAMSSAPLTMTTHTLKHRGKRLPTTP